MNVTKPHPIRIADAMYVVRRVNIGGFHFAKGLLFVGFLRGKDLKPALCRGRTVKSATIDEQEDQSNQRR